MKDMRVLVVTPWFPSAKAPGSGLFNLRDVQLLAESNDVTVLHLVRPELFEPNVAKELVNEGLSVVRVPYSFERPATILSAAREISKLKSGFDLIHSMAFPALLPVKLAHPNIPWVHTEHYSQLVTPPASTRMAVTLAVLKRLFKYPTECIAVSRSLASVIDRYRKVPSTVVGNEVMLPIDPIPERHEYAPEIANQRVRMIAVGGIIDRKGPVLAVDTLIELRWRGVDATLTWVGEGVLAENMRTRAREAGVGASLELTGQLNPKDLSTRLLDADVFVLPVETETFGVAIAEALSHGLPVVTTGSGGHTEFLQDFASRLVARTSSELADAVEDVLQDSNTLTRAEIAAYAASQFSRSARKDAYSRVYDRALEMSIQNRR